MKFNPKALQDCLEHFRSNFCQEESPRLMLPNSGRIKGASAEDTTLVEAKATTRAAGSI